MLQLSDVVTCHAQPYFVVSLSDRTVRLLEPADFARKSIGQHTPWGRELTLPYREDPLTADRIAAMRPEELEYAKEREQAREQWLAELRGQLAVADDGTAEAARVAADGGSLCVCDAG
eukprot:2364432-Prymnesium_polylepis.1